MSVRNYNNVTTIGTLTAPVASSAVTFTVQNLNQYPAMPFTVTVDRNTATEEICLVTAVATGTLTVTRGFDGTAAQAHAAGATIEHTVGAIEYTEANQHVNATTNVHGVTGGLVGAEGAQSIYDKTLVSPVAQADAAAGDALVAFVPADAVPKNLIRGVDSTGADVLTVDGEGNVNAASLASTGDTNVHGNLAVTGTTTQTGLLSANGGITVPTGKKVTVTSAPTATTDAANKSYVDGAVAAKAPSASPTFTGTVTAPILRLTATGDASATSTGHAFQVGADNAANVIIDNNEIIGRSNGVLAPVGFGGSRVSNVGTPTAATDAATKGYADGVVQSIPGGTTAQAGTVPSAGAPVLMKGSSVVFTPDAGGQHSITFDTAFPHAVLSVVLSPGSTGQNLAMIELVSVDTTSAVVLCRNYTGTVITSGLVRVNYIAIGC